MRINGMNRTNERASDRPNERMNGLLHIVKWAIKRTNGSTCIVVYSDCHHRFHGSLFMLNFVQFDHIRTDDLINATLSIHSRTRVFSPPYLPTLPHRNASINFNITWQRIAAWRNRGERKCSCWKRHCHLTSIWSIPRSVSLNLTLSLSLSMNNQIDKDSSGQTIYWHNYYVTTKKVQQIEFWAVSKVSNGQIIVCWNRSKSITFCFFFYF